MMEVAADRLSLLEEVFRQAPTFLHVLRGPDLVFELANPAYYQLVGYRDLIGHSAFKVLPEAMASGEYAARILHVMRTCEPFMGRELSVTLARTAGAPPEERLIDLVYLPLLEPDGSCERVLGHGTDVTDQVRGSEARQNFLLKLADSLRALREPMEVQAAAARVLGEQLGADRAYYVEVDEARGEFVVQREWHRSGAPSRPRRYPLDAWPMPWLANQRPWVVSDVDIDPALPDEQRASYRGNNIGACVVVPLVKAGRLVATLMVNQSEPRAWDPTEVGIVEETAERTWAAVERARAETALGESEERLQRAVAATGLGVFDWEVATDQLTVNAHIRDMFDIPADMSLTVAEMIDKVHPRYRPLMQARLARALDPKSTGLFDVEYRSNTSRGERWFRASGQVDFAGANGDRRAVRLAGFLQDVTERRLAEEEVERARAAAEREELRRELAAAEEAERRRLARELHDQLGQQLTAFAIGTENVLRQVQTVGAHVDGSSMVADRLTHLNKLAREMQGGARYLALELRPPELDDVGLESALTTYAAQWSVRYGVASEVAVSGGGTRELPEEVGTALYRIVQEALTNVARHAEATAVSVLLETADSEVRLIIEDDGKGFDVEPTAARARRDRRLGMASMRERAALVNASIDVESTPGSGTTIYVRVPLPPR